MRAMVVHPGPNWSVADVYTGVTAGLEANGCTVENYDLGNWLWMLLNAHLRDDEGEFTPFLDEEMAAWCASSIVKGSLYSWWPDVVIFVSGFFVTDHLIEVAKRRGHKVVLWMTESPYEDDRQLRVAQNGADLTVLNDPTNIELFAEYGPTVYVPHSYNPTIHHPGPPDPARRSDVCFVGTGYPSRVEFLEQVDWSPYDLALLGHWESLEGHPLAGAVRQPKLDSCCDNDETADWYRSTRASFNLYRREITEGGRADGWAMGPREIELAACGTWFCSQPRGENVETFPFVPKFTDPAELDSLLSWALSHPDEVAVQVAKARAAVEGWTFADRVGEVLRLLDAQPVTV